MYVCMYVGSDGREGAGYEKSRALVRGRRLQQHVQAWAMAGVQVLFSFGPELAPAPGMRRPVMAMAGGGGMVGSGWVESWRVACVREREGVCELGGRKR